MLRYVTLLLATAATVSAAFAADLPRQYQPRGYVQRDPDLLFTPQDGPGGYIQNLPRTPILPGSAALPGYYGRAFSYDYQGPYYGGPYVSYWNRLPYACGVYGYC